MIFSSKVLQSAFERTDIPKLEEEINRLFRSNAFNFSTRLQFDESRKKKYPSLKEAAPNESIDLILKRMEMRTRVPKETNRQGLLKSKSEIRPLFSKLNPHGATNARSPLVSLLFPSRKDKMALFQESSNRVNLSSNSVDRPPQA